jgi:hypothetical protein
MQLEERDWETLLTRIKSGKCTPFLGAGVNDKILPLGSEVAQDWAFQFQYPLDSSKDLAKVAQFLAVQIDASFPKEQMLLHLDKSQKPLNFNDADEPLNVLAKLELPVYLTTNYDDLLSQAIEFHGRSTGRKGRIEICRWNRGLLSQASLFRKGSQFSPTKQTPVVFHLHGHKSVQHSLVLTEDDYLDFLVSMSKNESKSFLPPRIQEAITLSSILFIGYSLADIDFRVLFRGVLGNLEAALGKLSIAVQLPYEDGNPNKQRAEEYISRYFSKMRGTELRVYWGTARNFARELWARWRRFDV